MAALEVEKVPEKTLNQLFEIKLRDGFEIECKPTAAGDQYRILVRGDEVSKGWLTFSETTRVLWLALHRAGHRTIPELIGEEA